MRHSNTKSYFKKRRRGRRVWGAAYAALLIITVTAIIVVFSLPNCANRGEPEILLPTDEMEILPYAVLLQQSEDGVWRLSIDGHEMILVNKTYHLPPDFGGGIQPQAEQAYEEMAEASAEAELPIYIISGYRSFLDQQAIFEDWAVRYGSEEEANRVSARAGESEHQTGLTFDFGSTWEGYDLAFDFADTQTGRWLAEHAPDYGFILRYPDGKEELTGYQFEPWHFRYVGPELARIITDSGLCVEEFLEYLPQE